MLFWFWNNPEKHNKSEFPRQMHHFALNTLTVTRNEYTSLFDSSCVFQVKVSKRRFWNRNFKRNYSKSSNIFYQNIYFSIALAPFCGIHSLSYNYSFSYCFGLEIILTWNRCPTVWLITGLDRLILKWALIPFFSDNEHWFHRFK